MADYDGIVDGGDDDARVSRYALRHVAANPPSWGPVVFVLSLVILAISRNLLGVVIFGPMAIAGLYFWWKPPRYNFWVELDDAGIVLRVLNTIRIRYDDISSVEPRTHPKSAVVRSLYNGIMRFGNFFGSTWDLEGEGGGIDPYGVVVRFRRWIWIVHFPAIVIPRKNWVFLVEDGAALVRELRSRLGLEDTGISNPNT